MPGCSRVATTKDHLVPYSHGGTDDLSNLRPACKSCNSKRGNRILSGYGARVVVVIGPPAAGKTTYIAEHASPADIAIDLDAIARALMPIEPVGTHVYPEAVRQTAIAARAAAIEKATHRAYGCTVWIIHSIPHPNQLAEYRALRYEVVTIDPGRAIVEPRARDIRPPLMAKFVDRWYSIYGDAAQPIAIATQHDGARGLELVPITPGEWTPEW